MPRLCTVCGHPSKEAINKALLSGEAFRVIAERYGTSATALFRHKAEHMPVALVQAQEAASVAEADDLLSQVCDLQGRALSILDLAEKAGDLRTALMAIREARSNIELLAKLTGELDERAQLNVLVTPEWTAIRTAVMVALIPYRDAGVAVAAALEQEGPHASISG